MRIVFFDKKRCTYEAVENAHHMHIDYIDKKKCFAVYTEDGLKLFPCRDFDLHKIDC